MHLMDFTEWDIRRGLSYNGGKRGLDAGSRTYPWCSVSGVYYLAPSAAGGRGQVSRQVVGVLQGGSDAQLTMAKVMCEVLQKVGGVMCCHVRGWPGNKGQPNPYSSIWSKLFWYSYYFHTLEQRTLLLKKILIFLHGSRGVTRRLVHR